MFFQLIFLNRNRAFEYYGRNKGMAHHVKIGCWKCVKEVRVKLSCHINEENSNRNNVMVAVIGYCPTCHERLIHQENIVSIPED